METRVQAIVLKNKDYRDTDRLLTLYSYEQGKLYASARGVRRLKARLALMSEPLNEGIFILYRRRDSDTFWRVIGGTLQRVRSDLFRNFSHLFWLDYIREMFDLLTVEQQPNPAKYKLLNWFLDCARHYPELSPFALAFVLRFLDYSGHRVALHSCGHCGGQSAPKWFLNQSGIFCPDCEEKENFSKILPEEIRSLMFRLEKQPENVSAQTLKDSAVKEYIDYLLSFYLPRPLRSSACFAVMPMGVS